MEWAPVMVPLGLMVGASLLLAIRFNINSAAFLAMIDKLLTARNWDRALKLCRAAPNIPLVRVVDAGLRLELDREFVDDEAREDAAIEALLPKAAEESRRFMRLIWLAPIGLLAPVGAMLVPGPAQGIRIGVSLAGIVLAANHVRLAFSLRREVYAAVGAVAPWVGTRNSPLPN